MVAGPTKVRIVVCWFVLVFLLVLPHAALARDVQFSPLTVEDLIAVITDADRLTDAQKETLFAALLSVADSDSFSPDDLLTVLSLTEIEGVSLAEADFVVAALETAFAVLLSGESDLSTVMNALSRALDTQDLGVIDDLLQSQVDSSRAANALDRALMDSEYEEQNSNSPEEKEKGNGKEKEKDKKN
ncbi:MAG: hypothetical protein U9N00_03325 [Candidatus Bipolaricaulota bacterium]|nr:hypothetical protein [Candidatus Bipolaricaulota bacterium]